MAYQGSITLVDLSDGQPGAQGASVVAERELYYLKTNSSVVPQITDSNQITSTDRQNGWTSIVPTYVSNGNYYTCIETTLDDDGTTAILWSTPILNQGLTDANANAASALTQAGEASAATALLGGHFIYRVDTTPGTHTPSSANIVQTIRDNGEDVTDNPAKWGYNTHIGANGIKLRINEIDLSSWHATDGLTLYIPVLSGNTITSSKPSVQLTSSALTFYRFTNDNNNRKALELTSTGLNFYGSSYNDADVTLNLDGLKLVKGGIEAGTYSSSSTNFIYLSTDDYSSSPTITINGNSSGWRQIIGSKFGVKNDGSLYASNVDLTGKITASSGKIGNWTIEDTTSANPTYGGAIYTGTFGSNNGIFITPSYTSNTSIGGSTGSKNWCFTAGANFGVTTNGVLYASGATIAGNTIITGNTNIASSVTIGGKAQSEYLNTNNNLIWDTEWRNTSNAWSDWGSPTTREIVTLNGKRWLHLVTTTTPFEGYSQNSAKRAGYGEVQAGETVVASFTAYAAVAGQRGCIGIHWLNSSGSIISQSWANFNLETTSKRYISDVFTIPNNAVGFNVMIGDNSSSACEIWITEVKLEKSNTATNWSLAPQDTNVNQYITNIDNQRGITIKPVDSNDNNYLQINSTDIQFIRNNSAKTIITNSEITLYGGNTNNSYANVNSNGLQIYNDNKQVANFGVEARIGINNDNYSNIHITSNSMTISNKGVQTYKIENATDREVKVKIDLNHSFQSGDTSFSLDIELGRTVSSWINTGGVRGIVLTYDLWGDDYGDISQSYNGPTVIDTEGKYAFTSELNGSVMTITFGPGATLDDEIIYFTSVEFNFIAADPVVHNTIGAYANNTLSSPFKIGVGTASIPSNAMLVDFSGNTKIKGDLFIKCNDDSTGGMPLGTVREYTQSSRPSGLRYLYIDAFQVGYTVTLVIEFQMATSTASVGNYFTQILQEIPAPAHQHMRISGFGYTSGAIVGYWLAWTDGFWQLSARNLSGTTTGSSFGLTASLTYVTDGTLCRDNY